MSNIFETGTEKEQLDYILANLKPEDDWKKDVIENCETEKDYGLYYFLGMVSSNYVNTETEFKICDFEEFSEISEDVFYEQISEIAMEFIDYSIKYKGDQ